MSDTGTITVPVAPETQSAPPPPFQATTELVGGVQPSAYVQQQAAAAAAHAAQTAAPQPRVFTEAEVEAIRQQEKDKLYGPLDETKNKLQSLEQELATIRQEREAREAEAAAAQEAARVAEEEAQRAQLSAKEQIELLRSEFNTQFQAEKEERERAQALLAREREFQALQEYKAGRLADPAIQQSVMPHLHPYINGNSEQEIEDAIARAAQTSAQILGDVQAAQQSRFQQAPGVSTSAPTIGPAEVQQATRNLTAQDINTMSLDDYRKYREQLIKVRP